MMTRAVRATTALLEVKEFIDTQGRRIRDLEALVITKENTARLYLARAVELQAQLARAETTEPSGHEPPGSRRNDDTNQQLI
jgi:hypothetical protein